MKDAINALIELQSIDDEIRGFLLTREDLAASWVNRKMLDLGAEAKRIQDGGVERIERCERIVSLFD